MSARIKYCVSVGLAKHPMNWVSTSPAFYRGRGSIPKNLAVLDFCSDAPKTVIGHDVWIGKGVFIKGGVEIGNGAIIGMGSVVTKDVPPYTIVAGNSAREIRLRFTPPPPPTHAHTTTTELVQRLEDSHYWDMEPAKLKKYANLMNDPEKFLQALKEDEAM